MQPYGLPTTARHEMTELSLVFWRKRFYFPSSILRLRNHPLMVLQFWVVACRESASLGATQRETVRGYIESGKKEATLLTGGKVLGETGCYVEPTVFIDPKPDARVLREEIFGSVLVVQRFSSEEEVLKMANDTEYGWAAYAWTRDIKRALRLGRKLEAGSVGIKGAGQLDIKAPVGGWKREYLLDLFTVTIQHY